MVSKESGVKPKILIADDEELCQRALATFAKKAGFDPVLAGNGVEAVEKAKEGNFLMILVDILMPQMNGYQATEAIRKLSNGKDQIIVAMSGGII